MPDPSVVNARLLQLLRDVLPADLAEAEDLERIRDLVLEPGNPWDRRRFVPGHLTASALVRHPSLPRIALVHHKKLGLWLQPGGHAEPSEWEPVAVAAREAREEIGVEVEEDGALRDVDVHEIPARPGEPAHRHYDLRFAFRAPVAVLRGNGESHAVKWATLDDLAALGCDAGLRRAARKLLAVDNVPSGCGDDRP